MSNLDILIAHLETIKPEQFDMAEWCGTACCIAGHAIALSGKQWDHSVDDQLPPSRIAANWLDIDYGTAQQLFIPSMMDKSYDEITLEDALTVLRHYRDTGVVDWDLVDVYTGGSK